MSNTPKSKAVSFRDGMYGSTIILFIICLVISGALAVTYQITAPQIEQINKETADAARMQVLPEADSFTPADGSLPDGVTEYYTADNGAGVVVTAQNSSFGGTMTVMVGIDPEGAVTGVTVTEHADTPGLGTKAMEPDYLKQYQGLTALDDVDSIKDDSQVDQVTGATVSSDGVYGAVKSALAAYEEMGGSN